MDFRKRFQNLKVSAKLNMVVILCFSVLLAISLIVINQQTYNFSVETGQEHVAQETTVLLNHFQESTQNLLQGAKLIAADPGVRDSLANDDKTKLKIALLRGIDQFDLSDIEIVTPDKQHPLVIPRADNALRNDPDYQKSVDFLLAFGLSNIRTTGVLAGQSENGHELLLGAVTPVQGITGNKVVGALLTIRKIDISFLSAMNFGRASVNIGIIHNNYMVIRLVSATEQVEPKDQGEDAMTLSGVPLDPAVIAEAQTGHTVLSPTIVISDTKTPYMLAYAPLTVSQRIVGVLVIQTPLERIIIFQNQLATMLAVVITLLALAAVVVIALFSSQTIAAPLHKVQTVAEQMDHGDYSQRLKLASNDEIGQLAKAFNSMADSIQKREAELREQADALRVATARAKESARVKGEFLANISHELRTPLNAIIGFSDILLMGRSGVLTDKQKHQIVRLRENGTRLLTLINNLLDLTRIEARRVEINQRPFSPRALVQRLTTQMSVLAEKKNLEVTTVIEPNLPEMLVGDEQRIEQVVVNLLSNAFKFTEQGAVTFKIGADAEKKVWTLSVTDTGVGIPPHALDIIFEEFRQLDGSSTRAFKGSGLGLAITRNLVRIMDGQIAVVSASGEGSIFTVTLPLISEYDASPTPQEPLLQKVEACHA